MSARISNPMSVPLAYQVIQRLCRLQDRVAEQATGYAYAADCFCGAGGYWPLRDSKDYRNDFRAIEFIEDAVAEKLDAKCAESVTQEKHA